MAKAPQEPSGTHPDDSEEYQAFLDGVVSNIDTWKGSDEPTREFAARLVGQVRMFVRTTKRF